MAKFNRRRVLRGAVAAGGLAAGVTAATTISSGTFIAEARAQSARKTFVFVSGLFAGGWIWRRVADKLEQGGHKVYAPSLTGLADRSHLLSKDINLDTHIADVVNLIKWESLENVCLVAWSYAGFPAAGALESIGNSVSSIVWLDAFMPSDGQKVMDTTVVGGPFAKIIQAALEKGAPSFDPPPKFPVVAVSERDEPFARSKMTAHPVGTYVQPIKLSGALQKVAKKTYIRLPKFPQPFFDKALEDCKSDKSWATFVLPDTGHMAMLDAPDRLTELILQGSA